MNMRQTLLQPRVMATLGLCLVAAAVGLLAGYDFGVRVGGTRWLGIVAAACSAAFCTLLADSVASWLLGRKR